LAVFAAVVDANGFSAAAERLGTTRSAISKQVQKLEKAWDVRLLSRTSRSISLTEPGRLAYSHALQIAPLSELARQAATSLTGAPKGRLRMSASVAFGHTTIVPLLGRFLAQHPQVEMDLLLDDRFVDLVDERIDLALRITSKPPESFVARRLAPVRSLLCASPALRGMGAVTHPEHVRQLPSIVSLHEQRDRCWHFSKGGQAVRVLPDSRLNVNTSEGRCYLARTGVGIAVLPEYVCREYVARGELVVLLPEWTIHSSYGDTVWGIRLAEKRALPNVRAMIDFLVDNLPR
jgi:DNA-binding transcriptional LysR family regulator